MRTKLMLLAAAGMIALGTGAMSLSACGSSNGGSGRPPIAQLNEGLNLTDASDPSFGIGGAYVKAGRVVYFETRMGPLKPDAYRLFDKDKLEPENEMDARFVDANGHTFSLVRGGDTFIDPSWVPDMANGARLKNLESQTQRDNDYLMAQEAATALAALSTPALKPHVYHLLALGQAVPRLQPGAAAEEAAARAAAPADLPYGTNGCSSNYQTGGLYGENLYACGCFAWVCTTGTDTCSHHSSVWAKNFNNCTGTWDEQIIACNHGPCANAGGSMKGQCTTTSATTANDLFGIGYSAETYNQNTGYTAGCLSGYNWDTPPGHECNDDSAYELYQIKQGTSQTSYGNGTSFCVTGHRETSDSDTGNFGCNQGSYGCDGTDDWQIPACP